MKTKAEYNSPWEIITPKRFLPFSLPVRMWWRLRIALNYFIDRGFWCWDIRTGELYWNKKNCELYGIKSPHKSPKGMLHDYNSFSAILHDEPDRVTVARDVDMAKHVRSIYYSAFRATDQTTGETIIVQAKGRFIYDKKGEPLVMIGWNHRLPYTREAKNLIIIHQIDAQKPKHGTPQQPL